MEERRKRGPAGVREITEWGPNALEDPRDEWLTGLFEAWHQDPDADWREETSGPLDLDSAIEWALARSENVIISIDRETYGVGARADDRVRPWPPPGGPPRLGRRRRKGLEWLDRSAADAPATWAVEGVVVLLPGGAEDTARVEAVVTRARSAPHVVAARWTRDEDDPDAAQGYVVSVHVEGGRPEGMELDPRPYRLLLDVESATPGAAELIAASALGDAFSEEHVSWHVRPRR